MNVLCFSILAAALFAGVTALPIAAQDAPSTEAAETTTNGQTLPDIDGQADENGAQPFITSPAQCQCTANLYSCQDFQSWSLAQACYNQCRIEVGFDIHELDANRSGIACELEYPDAASLDPEDFVGDDADLNDADGDEDSGGISPPQATNGDTQAEPVDEAADETVDEATDETVDGSGDEAVDPEAPLAAGAPAEVNRADNFVAPADPARSTEETVASVVTALLPMALIGAVVLFLVLVVGGAIGLWIARSMSGNPPRSTE